ncbi:MAG: peptide chain release factor N(5)-glutamine methyltransferase [Pseudomonadota bacterium]
MSDPAGSLGALRSLGALLGEGRERLRAAGVDSAGLDARLLLQHVAAVEHADLLVRSEAPASSGVAQAFDDAIARRAGGVPVAHIVGRREFWGLNIETGPDALVPRPDTEILVEAALEGLALVKTPVVADLGTGTGCILAAVLSERADATGVAVDLSPEAAGLAARNLARLVPERATVVRGHWAGPLAPARFDLVVSNPPYIETGDMAGLAREVRREPALALDGGADGLDAYRALIPSARAALREGGWLCVEIGRGQERDVARLFAGAGFARVATRADLAGIVRVVSGCRTAKSGDKGPA